MPTLCHSCCSISCRPQAAYRADTLLMSYELLTLLAVLAPTFCVIAVCPPGTAAVENFFLVAVGFMVVAQASHVPWHYFEQPPVIGDHVVIRVLSSNLRK